MINKFKQLFLNNAEFLLAVLMLIVILFGIKFLWSYFNLPNQEASFEIIRDFYLKHGIWVLFISAIIESMFLIGNYFPGSLIIFIAMSLASGNIIKAIYSAITIILAINIGYSINYILGKIGWYKLLAKYGMDSSVNNIKIKITEKGTIHALPLYFMPATGSILSTVLGIIKYPYIKYFFLTFIAVTIFNSIWATLVYFIGMPVFYFITNIYVILPIMIIILYYNMKKYKLNDNK